MSARCRAGGFTLLEMLIAMTLFSFILTLLLGGLRISTRSWDAGDERSADNAQVALLQGFLRREFGAVVPLRWQALTDVGVAFAGEVGRVQFVAPVAVRAGQGGLNLFSIELRRDAGKDEGALVMRRAVPDQANPGFSSIARAEVEVLAEGVTALEFAYYGPDVMNNDPQWRTEWVTQPRLPYLIRMRLKFSDRREWPDLIVAPQVGNETGCLWSDRQRRCVGG